MSTCARCQGKGTIPCPVCKGSGTEFSLLGPTKCGQCNGTGEVKCPVCNGKGYI